MTSNLINFNLTYNDFKLGDYHAILNMDHIPEFVYQDNGRAFKSKFFNGDKKFEELGFTGVYEKLGIKPVYATPYNARAKVIERFFLDFQEGFEKLMPSYIGTSIENKPAWMKRNEKLHKAIHEKYEFTPTMEQAIALINKWLEYKHSQPCTNAKGKTIKEVLDEIKKQNIDEKNLDDLMMAQEIKTIGRNGIRFLKADYFDEELYGIKEKAIIKYSLFDLSYIKVYSLKGEFICKANRVTETHPLATQMGDIIKRISHTDLGGKGNNTIIINADNCELSGSTGNDSFIINGDNNTVLGQEGNDYFIIESGNSNKIYGGDKFTAQGTDLYQDYGTNTSFTNVSKDPNNGSLNFSRLGETQTLELDGKTYTIRNNTTETVSTKSSNTLDFARNPNTGEISFIGDNFTITLEDNKTHSINIKGNYNLINGSNSNDTIKISEGSNNKILGKDGDDTIISNSANNKIFGGKGHDQITVNYENGNNIIEGEDGNDTISINSSNNTNINGGNGDDTISIKGDNNTIDGNNGADTISLTGNSNNININDGNNNIYATGNSNNIVQIGDDSNKIALTGEANQATLGNGNNNITINTLSNIANGNNITTGNGDNVINIYGEKTNITSGDGNNKIKGGSISSVLTLGNGNNEIDIKGDNNTLNTGNGNNKIKIIGDNGIIETGTGIDDITIKGNNNNIDASDEANKIIVEGNENIILAGNEIDNIFVNGNKNEVFAGAGDDEINILSGNNNYVDGEEGINILKDSAINTTYSNIYAITKAVDPFEIQNGANEEDIFSLNTGFSLPMSIIDIETQENSYSAIDNIDKMLNSINEKLTSLGASKSNLLSMNTCNTDRKINLISTNSTLRDADIAKEKAEMTKLQIIQQYTASAFMQSQQLTQKQVAKLLNF